MDGDFLASLSLLSRYCFTLPVGSTLARVGSRLALERTWVIQAVDLPQSRR